MSSPAFGKIPKWLVLLIATAALVGFVDAAYLTAEHVRGIIPPCSLTGGCEKVLTSAYASVVGVPLSVVGMVYYGLILMFVIAFFDTYDHTLLHKACWLIVGGFLGTLYLVYVQLFIIHAICLYCMVSALMSLILLVAATRIMRID